MERCSIVPRRTCSHRFVSVCLSYMEPSSGTSVADRRRTMPALAPRFHLLERSRRIRRRTRRQNGKRQAHQLCVKPFNRIQRQYSAVANTYTYARLCTHNIYYIYTHIYIRIQMHIQIYICMIPSIFPYRCLYNYIVTSWRGIAGGGSLKLPEQYSWIREPDPPLICYELWVGRLSAFSTFLVKFVRKRFEG